MEYKIGDKVKLKNGKVGRITSKKPYDNYNVKMQDGNYMNVKSGEMMKLPSYKPEKKPYSKKMGIDNTPAARALKSCKKDLY